MVTVLGCMSVMLDVVFSHMGALLVDPSFYWIMPVCAVFFGLIDSKCNQVILKKSLRPSQRDRTQSTYLISRR